nr:hypothetical protein [Planctomycetota bacterium]
AKAPPTAKAPPAARSVKPPVQEAPPSPMPEGGEDELVDEPAGPEVQPIDWKEFHASPEATALPAAVKTLTAQLGPLLEQLAVRAINAPLTDLSGQEFAALLLQVLPQALPPQHVQAALSPQALVGYQALLKYLARTGLATHGDDLVQGLKLVREQLRQQMRQAGILNGPDYSDPDEAVAPKV